MRILFVSNLYPPHFIGGYEQLCMDVAQGLAGRGHDCHVLTSTYGVVHPVEEGKVYRLLELEGDFKGNRPGFGEVRRIRKHNEATLREVCARVQPDIVFLWSMRRFSRSLLFLAEQLCDKVVYFVTDNWLLDQYRPMQQNLRKFVQSYHHLLKRPKLPYVICSSEHMKLEMVESGIPLDHASVVHNGVNLEPYLQMQHADKPYPSRILYAGRLVAEKGAHTLLQALKVLAETPDLPAPELTVVGAGEDAYVAELKRTVASAGLDHLVTFTGNVSREELTSFFATHDVFVFPSIWQEPFSLTLIMALASGMPVVGTLTGGSKEILKHMQNSLAFEAGDSSDLAAKLETLIRNPELGKTLAKQARLDCLACTLPVMVERVEAVLEKVFKS